MKNKYAVKEDKNINCHGVLKENRRIMERQIELNNDYAPKEFYIFDFPDKNIIKKPTRNGIEIRRTKTIKKLIRKDEEKNNKKN